MRKFLIDTDTASDDAVAMCMALRHPDIEVVGFTVVAGNVPLDQAVQNALYTVELCGAQTPVFVGAAAPLARDLETAQNVHGQDGMGDIGLDLQGRTPESGWAPQFIVDTIRENPGEITLVAIGPLSNIAEALEREPALPELVRELVIMGGTVEEPGNVSPLAEANFWNDPHAADAVLGADWPATVVGLDVTHRIMLDDEHLAHLRDAAGATGELIWQSSRFYIDFYARRANSARRECAMHDAAAVAHVVLPESFEHVSGAARVVPDGIAIGQLALDRKGHDYPEPHWKGRPSVAACLGVDAERVRALFLDTIVGHHRR